MGLLLYFILMISITILMIVVLKSTYVETFKNGNFVSGVNYKVTIGQIVLYLILNLIPIINIIFIMTSIIIFISNIMTKKDSDFHVKKYYIRNNSFLGKSINKLITFLNKEI